MRVIETKIKPPVKHRILKRLTINLTIIDYIVFCPPWKKQHFILRSKCCLFITSHDSDSMTIGRHTYQNVNLMGSFIVHHGPRERTCDTT
jgi:hypothetical protein